jgi:hypothetical protein
LLATSGVPRLGALLGGITTASDTKVAPTTAREV